MKNHADLIAGAALSNGAIKLSTDNPFQWASGFRMPVYNDNRMLLFNYDHRNIVTRGFLDIIEDSVGSTMLGETVIAGTSTAGIPWAALIANETMGPMVYIRDKPKDHGLKNRIEGIGAEFGLGGRSTVVIEDLISTGGSSAAAVQAVRDAQGGCDRCFSIFDYGFDEAREIFAGKRPYDKEGTKFLKHGCFTMSLLTYDKLLQVARDTGYLKADQVKMLEEWRLDPLGWGEKRGFPRVVKEKK